MKIQLFAAAIAVMGLSACSPDVTPPAGTAPNPAVSSAQAQPAAQVNAQDSDQSAAPTQEQGKQEAGAPEESEKKAD